MVGIDAVETSTAENPDPYITYNIPEKISTYIMILTIYFFEI